MSCRQKAKNQALVKKALQPSPRLALNRPMIYYYTN